MDATLHPDPFRTGDSIVLIKDGFTAATHGAKATVEHVDEMYLTVTWNRQDPRWKGQMDGRYPPDLFQRATFLIQEIPA